MKNKIKFIPEDDIANAIFEQPVPASKLIPEWYRNSPLHMDGTNLPLNQFSTTNATIKKCIPIFDSITSGYMFTLFCDVFFVDENSYNGNRAIWNRNSPKEPLSTHAQNQLGLMKGPYEHSEIFKWHFPYTIRTPKGYSCMFMHPNQRYDLPFKTLSAIVDTDKHPIPINFPFFLDKNFIGKIAKGTPICQILPFKREEWHMSIENNIKEQKKFFYEREKQKTYAEKRYRNEFWQRKKFS